MKIFMASAALGPIDVIKPLPEKPASMFAQLYTDQHIVDPRISASWSKVINPDWPRKDWTPRLRSRYFKYQIYRDAEKADWLVWVDASILLFELDFIEEWIEKLSKMPEEKRVLLVPHNQRETIMQEADFICDQIAARNPYLMKRYTEEGTRAQVRYLKQNNFDLNSKLYCTGFWIMENTPRARAFIYTVWDQIMKFDTGDQIAYGAILNKWGYKPTLLDVSITHNQHFTFVAHS
jgi:hypothetical protein